MAYAVAVTTAEGRYENLRSVRDPYLRRARDCAKLTIPALMPEEGEEGQTLYTPFQGVGARGVNNLAAKLLLALFPPGSSFFRLALDFFMVEKLRQKAGADASEDIEAQLEEALSKVERAVVNRIESVGARTPLFECLKHLVVCGNGLLQVLPDGRLKFFPLSRFVVKRDLVGNVLEIITKECLAEASLPENIRALVENMGDDDADTKKEPDTDEVELFTRVTRKQNGSWRVHQEVAGQIVPESEGFYPKNKSAFLPLRFNAVDGEDYGRGHVEEYFGDLSSLEALSQAIVDFAAAASKVILFVNEGGVVTRKKVADARSGDVISGEAKDVTTWQLDKYADFQVVKATMEGIETRLSQAFLLASSVQRQAERVTAEEVRYLAGELEQSLGGVYSVQAQELQLPLVSRYMLLMQKEGRLPFLPEQSVSPQIVTGLDGLGRTSDMMKLDLLISNIGQTFGPEALSEYVNVGALIKRRASALGIDIEGLVRSEDEVAASRQQAAMQSATEKLGGPAIKAMSDQAKVAAQGQAPAASSTPQQ